jgi:hypothetical protein
MTQFLPLRQTGRKIFSTASPSTPEQPGATNHTVSVDTPRTAWSLRPAATPDQPPEPVRHPICIAAVISEALQYTPDF